MRPPEKGTEIIEVFSEAGLHEFEKAPQSSLVRAKFSTIRKLIDILAQQIGLEIRYKIPKILARYPFETWCIVSYFETMRALGIVENFQLLENTYPDEPQGFGMRVNLKTKQKRIGHGGEGRDLFDIKRTLWPALGEALERWALSTYIPPKTECVIAPYRDVKEKKINIFNVVGFSKELRRTGHANYNLEFSEDTTFTWVWGKSLVTNDKILIPLQFLSFEYAREIIKTREPLLAPTMSTGAATGQNLESAITSGLLEVIERDAFMIYWLNKISPKLIDIESIPDPRFKKMLEVAKRYRLEIYLQYLKTDMPVHTLGILIRDRTGFEPAAIISAGSGFDFIDVAYKLISTSLVMRHAQRLFCEKRKEIRNLNTATLNHEERILYYSRQENISKLDFLMQGEHITYATLMERSKSSASNLEELVGFFRSKQYEIAYKEIIPEHIKNNLGSLTTVVVRVPEMQPLHLDETLPALEGRRLKEVPAYLGLLSAEEINRDPHPFP